MSEEQLKIEDAVFVDVHEKDNGQKTDGNADDMSTFFNNLKGKKFIVISENNEGLCEMHVSGAITPKDIVYFCEATKDYLFKQINNMNDSK